MSASHTHVLTSLRDEFGRTVSVEHPDLYIRICADVTRLVDGVFSGSMEGDARTVLPTLLDPADRSVGAGVPSALSPDRCLEVTAASIRRHLRSLAAMVLREVDERVIRDLLRTDGLANLAILAARSEEVARIEVSARAVMEERIGTHDVEDMDPATLDALAVLRRLTPYPPSFLRRLVSFVADVPRGDIIGQTLDAEVSRLLGVRQPRLSISRIEAAARAILEDPTLSPDDLRRIVEPVAWYGAWTLTNAAFAHPSADADSRRVLLGHLRHPSYFVRLAETPGFWGNAEVVDAVVEQVDTMEDRMDRADCRSHLLRRAPGPLWARLFCDQVADDPDLALRDLIVSERDRSAWIGPATLESLAHAVRIDPLPVEDWTARPSAEALLALADARCSVAA